MTHKRRGKMLNKVISGFQTGADIAGIVAAKRVGILTGGEMPKGFRTERGNRPDFAALYGATESPSSSYLPRTKLNAQVADLTLILSPISGSSGTRKTIEYCRQGKKPFLLLDPFQDDHTKAVDFIKKHRPSIVNVAGNRESVCQGLSKRGAAYLQVVFDAIVNR